MFASGKHPTSVFFVGCIFTRSFQPLGLRDDLNQQLWGTILQGYSVVIIQQIDGWHRLQAIEVADVGICYDIEKRDV